jgi:hypothetical protein
MGILFTFGAFALMQYLRAQALTGSASQVVTDMRDAQVRAQSEVRTYRITFDTSNNTYTISRLVSSDPDTYENLETNKGLDRGVALTLADFNDDGSVAFFYPRGTSSAGTVILESMQLNQDREITLTALTAKAEVN